ncbi:MAG: glycoside hydrolase family 95 protein [Verrucomicrobia bacterium]|nr:glycoside hydrolase family 95 protein [Verrucomicrobiota bacterium]MBU1734920.1 glycoside hydrolase family 95 protein [Verrucomicrobiota bacterium]MBU1857714.1 glycoside hydrolase family 95 protein [Verrucomicrobiota bacterium]
MPSQHVIAHQSPPLIWQDGLPLGNGLFGVMLWGDGNPLKMTLDCADLWDSRMDDSFWQHPDYNYANLRKLIKEGKYDEALAIFGDRGLKENAVTPTKLSIGRAELCLGEVREYEMRLDIDRAIVEGCLQTANGNHDVVGFVHRTRDVFCLRTKNAPATAELRLKPLGEVCESMAKLGHPPARQKSDGPRRFYSQEIPGGPCYALIWNAQGPDYFMAIACAAGIEAAEEKALAAWLDAERAGFDALRREHEAAWRDFWSRSAVYLPEPTMEILWFYGVYLLGSSARPGAMPPGLQGVWTMDGVIPPWRGDYHLDLNVQETFWPACASGHLELLDTWCDYMKACLPRARAFTRKVFGTEGTYWPGEIMGTFYKFFPTGVWYPLMAFAWSHSGWTGWLAWLRWRYSQDITWLRATGYPIIADIFRFYHGNLILETDGYLIEEQDGCLHVPLSTSPEYGLFWPEKSIAKDPNIDLALIRKCCDWIIEMEAALGLNDLTPSARTVKSKLAPYALSEKKELCLWPGKLLDISFLHPSHLMAIHPAMDLTIEGNEQERRIIEASVKHYLALGETGWAGHTYAQMISFASVLGQGAWAYDCLRQFAYHWIRPNGLHFNRDLEPNRYLVDKTPWHKCQQHMRDEWLRQAPFTMEANCAVSAGISDMLVQGWGDKIRIFPAVPACWRDLVFSNQLTEGAFRVSAARRMGQTVWVCVTATVDRILRLLDPFAGGAVDISGGTVQSEDGLFTARMTKGQTITLKRKGYVFDLNQAIRQVHENQPSVLGLPASV